MEQTRTPSGGRVFPSLGVGLAALCLLAAAWRPYRDGPPPAHTGGFDEPTCQACHFDGPLNAPGGHLTLDGVPEAYVAGRTYRLTVTLHRPAMAAGGFELAARLAESGLQAGAFDVAGGRVRLTGVDTSAVQYAVHTRAGTTPSAPDTARWSLVWHAPPGPAGPVVFHLAANAANDDDSEFGDFIYLTSRTVPPHAD